MKKNLILDVGGVIVELDFKNSISKLLNSKEANFELLFDKWLQSKAIREFEAGKISYQTFYEKMSAEFNLTIDIETFTKHFNSIIVAPFDGIDDFIKELSVDYNIYILSNITHIHWDNLEKYDFIKKYIKYSFLSCDIGSAKPEDEIFQYAIKQIGVPAKEILYFDDNKSNVEAGKRNGLQSYQTIGLESLKETFYSLKKALITNPKLK